MYIYGRQWCCLQTSHKMAITYYDKDADLTVLQGRKIGIVGYGNQGRAQALNMRDSGIRDIMVATARDTSFEQAVEDGFEAMDVPEMIPGADIVFMLIPDEIMPQVYREQIAPNLQKGCVLNFASGYNITYRHIIPPDDADVIMVAPRMIGDGVRNLFLSGEGYFAFVGIEQDASGKAKQTALALGKAMGATKKGCIEVTFRDETMMDLLAEQAIWPMIISIITEAFKFEVEKGHPAEASLVELYICKEPAYMFEKMAEFGKPLTESKIQHVEHIHPQSEIKKLVCDYSKAQELLGWEPKVSLEEGIKKTEDWIKSKSEC